MKFFNCLLPKRSFVTPSVNSAASDPATKLAGLVTNVSNKALLLTPMSLPSILVSTSFKSPFSLCNHGVKGASALPAAPNPNPEAKCSPKLLKPAVGLMGLKGLVTSICEKAPNLIPSYPPYPA